MDGRFIHGLNFTRFYSGKFAWGIGCLAENPKNAEEFDISCNPLFCDPILPVGNDFGLSFCYQHANISLSGSFTVGSVRGFNWDTLMDLLYHSALPIISMVLTVAGFWALSMRGVMTSVIGEDYLIYARIKGLRERRIFSRYAVRNALLPQVTALAIDLGSMMSGQVLVEIIFNYPGIGWVLYNALRTADYFVIQGVVLFMIGCVALATLIVDLIYPLLDPRIRY